MARSTTAKISCIREFWKQNCNVRDQITELGKGSEESGLKFLWVLKAKIVDKDDSQGLDEIEILSHPAVGGFVSHCGWNSVMEAAARGMPMLEWPQLGDQKVNAGVVEAAGLGVWEKSWGWLGERLVKGEEIAKMVKKVMCDDSLRENATIIGEEGLNATKAGGSLIRVDMYITDRVYEVILDLPPPKKSVTTDVSPEKAVTAAFSSESVVTFVFHKLLQFKNYVFLVS
ncbi:UDP-glycosyltransferase 13 [Artemisia annua]|uniref:UDP-glycosyltransferase 13 n=1 Tax=Artemisia annua TaxID=35608 RepID=A0A2U1KWI1_ARTAN|nr:UDP-glycosyltransferase 13 [Artemisia annua]